MEFQRSASKERSRLFPNGNTADVDVHAVSSADPEVLGIAASDSPAIADDDVCLSMEDAVAFTEHQRDTAFIIAREHNRRVTRSMTNALAQQC